MQWHNAVLLHTTNHNDQVLIIMKLAGKGEVREFNTMKGTSREYSCLNADKIDFVC